MAEVNYTLPVVVEDITYRIDPEELRRVVLEELEFTQAGFAEECGVTPGWISFILSPNSKKPLLLKRSSSVIQTLLHYGIELE